MVEYKVFDTFIKDLESLLNKYAKEGWKVVSITPNIAKGMGVVVVMERTI